MNYEKYVGHSFQISGVMESVISKGKGKGMTLLTVRNGKGLEIIFCADRAMDISQLSFKGDNIGFFSPCGYVAPSFYDKDGAGFLKSFTAGFLTTCGLTAVGSPCVDDGEELGLHGTISNTPCENYSYDETDEEIIINAKVRDAAIFGHKLIISRKFICSKKENKLIIEDEIKNIGTTAVPCMLLYHFNMGFPLLSENARLVIPNSSVAGRDEFAQSEIEKALLIPKPLANCQEQCFYYDVLEKNGVASCGIYNPDIGKGLKLSFNKDTLPYFTEWKMPGEGEYVLGLEPANCTPEGRDVMREKGILKFLNSKESYKTKIMFEFTEDENTILKL